MKDSNEIKILFKFWLPAIVWMGVIFYFSSQSGEFDPDKANSVGEFFVRKFAHICEFGFLAVFFLILLIRGCGSSSNYAFPIAFILAVIYALSDEYHQTFIFGRNGNIRDVALDSLGALLFLQLIAFSLFAKKRRILFSTILGDFFAIFIILRLILQSIVVEVPIYKYNFNNQDTEIEQSQPESATGSAKKDNDSIAGGILKKEQNEEQDEIVVPKEIILPVPFSSQAPFAIWDEIHEEACEEMSLIMVKYYFDRKKITPEIAENEIQKMKEYQLKRNGHFIDSDMDELSAMANEYFDLQNARVKYNITKQDILESLTQGSPVIVPAAGRLLGNPNFSGLGPLYHVIVIVGFDGDDFITNDPGTRKGKHFRYKFNVLMNAIHDYPGNKNDIERGVKAGIVFLKGE